MSCRLSAFTAFGTPASIHQSHSAHVLYTLKALKSPSRDPGFLLGGLGRPVDGDAGNSGVGNVDC